MTLTPAMDRFKLLFHDLKSTYKESGFRGLIQKYGWKLFITFFIYYLVRDLILYIALPALVAKHFLLEI